ncbi:cytochrome P450 [Cytidiella melzeri]|nr:cytochrome P450 [Cytidiella melzeri]
MSQFPPVLLVLGPVTIFVTYCILRGQRGNHHTSPGPPPAFIVGNALQVPKERSWLQFTEWARVYGDIITLRIFREHMIVINSYALASQLLEGPKSAQYADKPRVRMAEMSGYGSTSLVQSYTKPLRHSRKLMQAELSARALRSYQGLQEQEARQFALRLLQDPLSFMDHIRLLISSNLLKIAYGHQVEGPHDEVMLLAEDVMKNLSEVVTPFAWLIDCVPALAYIPPRLTGLQKIADRYRETLVKFANMPFETVKQQMRMDVAAPSFVSNQLEGKIDTISEEESEGLKYTIAAIYAALSVQTMSFLSTFFLAMALHPSFQEKAQAEIDREFEQKALPTFADRERLPYITCILKEVLRWRPPVPIMVRATLQDDVINGVHVPAGATIATNTWAFTRDAEQYSDPDAFNPDRFLSDGDEAVMDPRRYVFGYSRRICPGVDYVNSLGYITLATTLAVFKILPETDDPSPLAHLAEEYTDGIVSHPKPFCCRIVPRSAELVDLVNSTARS